MGQIQPTACFLYVRFYSITPKLSHLHIAYGHIHVTTAIVVTTEALRRQNLKYLLSLPTPGLDRSLV